MGRTWGCRDEHPEGGGRERTPGPVAHKTPQGAGPVASRAPPVRCQLPPAAASRSSPPRPLGPFHLARLGLGFCWFLGDKNRLK